MSVIYHLPSSRVAGTWSLPTGTPRTGFGAAKLSNGDPSDPCWITGNSIAAVNAFDASATVYGVAIVGHTFVTGCDLRLQLNGSNSWGAPDVDIAVPIPTPYRDGVTANLYVNVFEAYPGIGTEAYLRIINTSPNAVTVAMGEVWIAGDRHTFARSMRFGFSQPRERRAVTHESKRSVQTVYDRGTNRRRLKASFPLDDADFEALRTLEDDCRGIVRMFPIVPEALDDRARLREPMLVRFANTITDTPQADPGTTFPSVEFVEQGRGTLLGV